MGGRVWFEKNQSGGSTFLFTVDYGTPAEEKEELQDLITGDVQEATVVPATAFTLDEFGDDPFGVVLSDDLCLTGDDEGVLAQMVRLYNQFRCSIVAIQEVPDDQVSKFGIIAGEKMKEGLYQVSDMVEKPDIADAPSNLAIIGRYILTPDIFDVLENTPPGKNGEVQLTDALLTQAQNGCVMAYKFKGQRFDCGSVEGFVDATNYVYNNVYKPV